MLETTSDEGIRVIGSHWNRYKVRDEGTGIKWNKDLGRWEVMVLRNLGAFDSLVEAAAVLERHLKGVESFLLEEFLDENNKVLMAPTSVILDEQAFEISKQVQKIEQRRTERTSSDYPRTHLHEPGTEEQSLE